jgi:hypothetical protein
LDGCRKGGLKNLKEAISIDEMASFFIQKVIIQLIFFSPFQELSIQ